jgi:predicted Zn-dependent protease
MITSPRSYKEFLLQGIHAMEEGKLADAMALLKKSAVADFSHPEPWYWMGRIYEREGKKESAGYAFYMALDLNGLFQPAREALEKLGYLSKKGL